MAPIYWALIAYGALVAYYVIEYQEFCRESGWHCIRTQQPREHSMVSKNTQYRLHYSTTR